MGQPHKNYDPKDDYDHKNGPKNDPSQLQAQLQGQLNLQGQGQGQGQAQGQVETQSAAQSLYSSSDSKNLNGNANGNLNGNGNLNYNDNDNHNSNELANTVSNSTDNCVENCLDNKIDNAVHNSVDTCVNVSVNVDASLSSSTPSAPVIDLHGISPVDSLIMPDVVNQTLSGGGNEFNIDQVNNLVNNATIYDPSVSYSAGDGCYPDAGFHMDAKILSGDSMINGGHTGDVVGAAASGITSHADAALTQDAFTQTITTGANIQFNSLTMNVAGHDWTDDHSVGVPG